MAKKRFNFENPATAFISEIQADQAPRDEAKHPDQAPRDEAKHPDQAPQSSGFESLKALAISKPQQIADSLKLAESQTRSKRVHILLEPSLFDALKITGSIQGISFNEIVHMALIEWIEKNIK